MQSAPWPGEPVGADLDQR